MWGCVCPRNVKRGGGDGTDPDLNDELGGGLINDGGWAFSWLVISSSRWVIHGTTARMASLVYSRSTDRPPPRSSKGYETDVPRHKSADQVLDTLAAHCRRAQMQDSSCRLERVRARSVSRGRPWFARGLSYGVNTNGIAPT